MVQLILVSIIIYNYESLFFQFKVETVEEQIVRHLTGKRIKELDKTLSKTREEYTLVLVVPQSLRAVCTLLLLYRALKKEIEQLEKGELDDQLQMIWEQSHL